MKGNETLDISRKYSIIDIGLGRKGFFNLLLIDVETREKEWGEIDMNLFPDRGYIVSFINPTSRKMQILKKNEMIKLYCLH